MTQGLASKMIREEIRINGLAPGITASEMTGYDTEGNLFSGASPNGRIYLPEEVAEIACFLISDISSCISGQIIYCNNGKTLNTRW